MDFFNVYRVLLTLTALLSNPILHACAYSSMYYSTEDNIIIRVNKCCEKDEVMVGTRCTNITEVDTNPFAPVFSVDGQDNIQVKNYKFAIGLPDCGSMQQWPVYHYENSDDKLMLLPNGHLRHYIHYKSISHGIEASPMDGNEPHFYDYEPGKYCLDKRLDQNGSLVSQYAIICKPDMPTFWDDSNMIIRKIVDPFFHVIAIICYLFVAVVYFVIPTLRDLTGNIVTTIALCLLTSTAANLVYIFTEFSSHVSFLIAEIFMYLSILGAFFWLNSLGYYIWKMFRSRNVFLRVTDGRKYCYYSFYAWGCTLTLGVIAIFAYLMFSNPNDQKSIMHDQETIGWVGVTVFFTPVACTILVNIYFYTTTLQILNRMHTYGRIHHKLKHSFRMFMLLFVVMSISWLFLLLSWIKFDALYYSYVFVNSIQPILFIYICVYDQKHVSFLLRKVCCYANCVFPCCRPDPECTGPGEWGDELQAMNTGIY